MVAAALSNARRSSAQGRLPSNGCGTGNGPGAR
jgi:hypothetical protein